MQTLDILIFVVFFAINLIVGALARGKQQSFRDFAVGSRNFSTATLIATLVATWAAGGTFFNVVQETYSTGLYFIIAVFVGVSAGWLITGYVIAPRMGSLLDHVSMSDALGSIYGKKIQLITAISALLQSLGFIAIQFKVISKILTALFALQGDIVIYVTILAATIVIVYSAFGGVKAVTFTDVVQFITFGTFLPALALTIWGNIGDPKLVLATLQGDPNFSLSHVFTWNNSFIDMLMLMVLCLCDAPSLPPELFQRMAMAKDIRQIKQVMTYTVCIFLLLICFMAWIAILLLADNPELEPSALVQYMIDKHTYVGLKGFLGIGIIALAMSSADSLLNSSSVLVANDILPPLGLTKEASVKSASRATFALGFLAILLTFSIQNILEIIYLTANFYMPIVTVPMLLTIFGFKTTKRVIYIGIVAGAVVTLLFSIYSKSIDAFFPGMFTNLIFLLGSHYLLRERGGWIKRKRKDVEQVFPNDTVWKKGKRSVDQLHKFKLLPYIKENLPNRPYYFPLLGLYLIIASYFSLYSVPHAIQAQHLWLYRFIQYAILYIVPSLVLFPLWPTRLRETRFLAWLFPGLLVFPFFFLGFNIVLLSGFAPVSTMVFMLHIIVPVMLSSYMLVLTSAAIGVSAAAIFFKIFVGTITPLSEVLTIHFQVGYALLFFITALIALLRFKHANQSLRGQTKQLTELNESNLKELLKAVKVEERFAKSLDVEGVQELQNTARRANQAVSVLRALIEGMPLLPEYKPLLKEVQERLVTTAQYLKQASHRATTYMQLQPSTMTVKELINKSLMQLHFDDLVEEPNIIVRFVDGIEHRKVQADAAKVKDLFFNAITYVLRELSDKKRRVLISLDETHLGYNLNSVEGHMQEVPAIRIIITTLAHLPVKLERYVSNMENSIFEIPITESVLHLFLAQKILHAHYGFMSVGDMGHDQISQIYIIPQQMRDIRPKEMDFSEIDPDTTLAASDETYPGAKEKEEEFLACLQLTTPEELALVHKAIRVIKKYHGPVKRKSGEPFYLHPITVAQIVTDFTQDADVVIAALLHDMVEDTAVTLSLIKLMFTDRIGNLVDRVTHLDNLGNVVYRLHLKDHENLNQLLDAEDKGALYVKLADRMHNMRTIHFHSSLDKQKAIAGETLSFFVPLAKYLGLDAVAEELQTMSTKVIGKKEN